LKTKFLKSAKEGDEWLVQFHDETLGITQAALTALRNELCERFHNEILVFQVPSRENSCRCYGFIILDRIFKDIVIVGDGFRADGKGEGGAGHRAAQTLLTLLGVRQVEMLYPQQAIEFSAELSAYEAYLQLLLSYASVENWQKPCEQIPHYVDFLFSDLR